jgi:2-polyprenyl-3-methyl-5-hydroxy-6-metoxy-1,4-benzoquinol methylase
MTNLFDLINIDINLKHQEIENKKDKHPFGSFSFFKKLSHFFLKKIGLFSKLAEAGFLRRWFNEFNFYWQKELGGRPLKFQDFFYLHSLYRSRYQNLKLEDETNPNQFLNDWQKPENIYQTFSCAYQYGINPFSYFPFKKYLKKEMSILEYGCGFAPISASLFHYEPNKFNLTIADIPNFPFHYAKWKLKPFNVKTININPNNLPLLEKYDVIFLIAVLEHLPNPLEIIKYLTNHLNKNGFFIFDYIKSEAEGFDTNQSLAERDKVLNFIKENFSIIEGKINLEKNIKNTVCLKK